MAEAFLNALWGDKSEAKSSRATPTGLSPHVVEAMAEVGIDL
jgi:arsenate reductase